MKTRNTDMPKSTTVSFKEANAFRPCMSGPVWGRTRSTDLAGTGVAVSSILCPRVDQVHPCRFNATDGNRFGHIWHFSSVSWLQSDLSTPTINIGQQILA